MTHIPSASSTASGSTMTNESVTGSSLSCWVVTGGNAGMEIQCIALAEAMGLVPVVKRIKLRSPWRQLTPFVRLV